jgi:hypothetical protein
MLPSLFELTGIPANGSKHEEALNSRRAVEIALLEQTSSKRLRICGRTHPHLKFRDKRLFGQTASACRISQQKFERVLEVPGPQGKRQPVRSRLGR